MPGPKTEEKWQRSGYCFQYVVAVIASLTSFTFGMSGGWASVAQIPLQSANSPMGSPLSDGAFSWVESMMFLGGIAGTLFWAKVADSFGRKVTGFAVAAVAIAAWAVTSFTSSYPLLLAARFAAGVSGSGSLVFGPLYISEIARGAIRGRLCAFVIMFLNGGILAAYVAGAFLTYRYFTLACLGPPVVFAVLWFLAPETPVYLWKKGRKEDAELSIMRLRGNNRKLLEEEIETLASHEEVKTSAGLKDLVKSVGRRRVMVIGLGLNAFQQFCGNLVVISYSVTILKNSSDFFSAEKSSILVGVFLLLGSLLSSSVVEHSGRKILLLISFAVMFTTMVSIGVYNFLSSSGVGLGGLGWIPVLALCLHVIVYGVGAGPMAYVVAADCLPADIKATAMSAFAMWGSVLAYANVQVYPFLANALGLYGAFWAYAACNVVAFVFTLVLIPETKGKTVYEIMDLLNGGPEEQRDT